ncbi:MAG: 5-methylcytosine restriction system specificity protein McrC, partial [Cetobacterium sp.]
KLLINKNSNKSILTLTPDIVLYEDSKAKLIIDTKWKNNYTSNDIYQIHTYLTSYEDVKKGILIYPQSLSKSENIFLETSSLNNKKEIEIIYLNIFDIKLTKSILRNLLINI